MGNMAFSHLIQSNRQLQRQHFLHYYEEGIAKQYFPQSQNYGYRKGHIQQQAKVNLSIVSSETTEGENTKKPLIQSKSKSRVDTSVYPFCCIGLLIVHFKQNTRYGTGSLIGKNLILTAASNIYDKETAQFASKIQLVLGVAKGKGTVFEIDRRNIHLNQKFIDESQGSHRYDYALLQVQQECDFSIEDQEKQQEKGLNDIRYNPGLTFGYLGINTNFKVKESVYLFGYSSQTGEQGEVDYQLRESKAQNMFCKNSALGYKMESQPSQCGSPLVVRRGDYCQVIGIHINGTKGLSCGLQFDQNIRKDINRWVEKVQGTIELIDTALSNLELNKFLTLKWHNIVSLNLNKNNICNCGLTQLTKKDWPMLRELHLCQNKISKIEIHPDAIINVNKLLLAQNGIKNPNPLKRLPLLKVLNLSVNKIDRIDELCELIQMERLDLTSNKITKLPLQISKMKELRKLYFGRNQLDNLSNQLLKLLNLTLLTIDRNKFKTKPMEVISKLEARGVQVIGQ